MRPLAHKVDSRPKVLRPKEIQHEEWRRYARPTASAPVGDRRAGARQRRPVRRRCTRPRSPIPTPSGASTAGGSTGSQPYTRVKHTSFDYHNVSIKWFEDGKLNVSANCVDRHLATRADQTAIIWESDDPEVSRHISYRELHEQVSKFGNVLHGLGVRKGDRVVIYLPMIPEAAFAMLACARIGAVHSIVFAGFSAEALRSRVEDSGAKLVITADEAPRGGRRTPLKTNADKALQGMSGVTQLVVRRTGGDVPWTPDRDVWLHEEMDRVSDHCAPVAMGAEDPLFILYTSGSTGQPKGVVHTTGGYLVYAAMTHEYVFDYHDGDVYWCTADVGWVTGHSYIVYGPLANGATTLMFEGVPTWPDAAASGRSARSTRSTSSTPRRPRSAR